MRGGGDTWKVKDFMDNYPDTNVRKEMYRRIKAPEEGFLKIIPITGCFFHNYPKIAGADRTGHLGAMPKSCCLI